MNAATLVCGGRRANHRDDAMIRLFSYGTLQQKDVQRANYGRLLAGTPDTLLGYRLQPVEIDNPDVVGLSGKAIHNIACFTGDSSHRIRGLRFTLSNDELAATDAYETSAYVRVEVELESGLRAYCYVERAGGTPLSSSPA